jgi:hypothetical protein
MGILVCIGLTICIITWGLQYKLSLYDPPQAASHQMPKAKLLSKNEQSRAAESPFVVLAKTQTKVIYTVPATASFIMLLVLSILNPPASGKKEQRADQFSQLRLRAFLNSLFVRPPPILV